MQLLLILGIDGPAGILGHMTASKSACLGPFEALEASWLLVSLLQPQICPHSFKTYAVWGPFPPRQPFGVEAGKLADAYNQLQ